MEKFPFLFFLCSLIFLQNIYGQVDTITTTQFSKDGETIVSSDGTFELGFFSPGNTSTNRYVGIWYKQISIITPVWVANRISPVTNKSGVLKLIQPGVVVLVNDTNATVWSTNSPRTVQIPVAQLLNTGNFLVRDANDPNPENFLWQSFDYPTDTLIANMKLGRELVTGLESDGVGVGVTDGVGSWWCVRRLVAGMGDGRRKDRPSMSNVIMMLSNEGILPPAKHPGFFPERKVEGVDQFSWSTQTPSSINEVTITLLDAR
ncbi:hypothetical protein RND71_024278 [Anisodus tanguticus]|uniref:Bulb-type lectin domain-containing protein n=1 Tax=Anisodus tanguticus TaxID=243964 RepID=A0AAE1RQS8_9SOLA|nr:hypothetical protein RND71_024278 [Anisodus tanguticus]